MYICLNWVAIVIKGYDHLGKPGPGDGKSL